MEFQWRRQILALEVGVQWRSQYQNKGDEAKSLITPEAPSPSVIDGGGAVRAGGGVIVSLNYL